MVTFWHTACCTSCVLLLYLAIKGAFLFTGHSTFPVWWHYWWLVGPTGGLIGSSQRARRYLNLRPGNLRRAKTWRRTALILLHSKERAAYTISWSSKSLSAAAAASLASCCQGIGGKVELGAIGLMAWHLALPYRLNASRYRSTHSHSSTTSNVSGTETRLKT